MARRKVLPKSSQHNAGPLQHRLRYARRRILGRSYNTWTVIFLRAFLSHYGRSMPRATSKSHLMHVMAQVAQEYGLEDSDYHDMYEAFWGRRTLPACKRISPRLRPAANANTRLQVLPTDSPLSSVSMITTREHPTGALDTNSPLLPSHAPPLGPEFPQKSCVVCWNDLVTDTTPQRAVTSDCTHERNVCLLCVSKSIANQLDMVRWDQMTCPACNAHIRSADVQLLASVEVFARHDRFSSLNI